jgi:peptidyl-dipeptidase A
MSPSRLLLIGLILLAGGWYVMNHLADRRRPTAPPPASQEALLSQDSTDFLAAYNERYRRLWTDAEGSKWDANSDINEQNTQERIAAEQRLADYVGSQEIIQRLQELRLRPDLSDLQRRQVEKAWQQAAHHPASAGQWVTELIQTEAAQNDALYSYQYMLALPGQPPRSVSPNEIADLLASADDLTLRQAVWECSKSIGPTLKDGLVKLQQLRNRVAREMGYSSFFGLEVADYGMTSDEMMKLMDELLAGIRPLYLQLHCWAKHELAEHFGVPAPRRIPAHWLGNRWAQEWPGLAPGVDLDALFADKDPAWIIQQAEKFYVSLGLPPLPTTFWERSDLFELPAGATRKKNTHASAWHIDLDQDVRSLMSIKANYDWFTTTHHELGHIYYYLAYSHPGVPAILRAGANRAFHEGVGTLIELASNQLPYLQQIGVLGPDDAPEAIGWLLSQALQGPVTFLPFACGTMTHFEYDLYEANLPPDRYNARWWEHAARFQGIEPPTPRGEEFCDAATKTHISDDPAQYYDYAISAVILHQLHRHICQEILHQDVHAANYYDQTEVGSYLNAVMAVGATRDWRELMLSATGERLSSSALLEYFAPLQKWLEQQNSGRDVSFD